MTSAWSGIGNHDNDHMFASTNGFTPTRKEPGIAEPYATTNLSGISERLSNTLPILGEQIRMALGDMLFPLLR
jgi:hypothetical protein